jgi:hypothetical protein
VPLESTCGAANMTVDAASTTAGLKLPLENSVKTKDERRSVWDTCLSNSEKCSRITPICPSKHRSRSPMISSCISLCAFARANVSFPCWRRMDTSLPMTCPCASLRFRSWPSRWAVRRSWACKLCSLSEDSPEKRESPTYLRVHGIPGRHLATECCENYSIWLRSGRDYAQE